MSMSEEGQTLLGPGWAAVENFDDVDDDDYEDEEEEYVVLDLGTSMDARTLQTEATYQLVGLDTPQPFLKIGDHIFVGAVTPLIGDEVVFDVIRQEDDPQKPQHRPVLTTHARVSMREVTLIPKLTHAEAALPELHHGMFPQRAGAEEASTPKRPAPARRKSARTPATGTGASTPAPTSGTPAPATGTATPAAGTGTGTSTPVPAATPASKAGTPATDRKTGRPKGRLTRVSMPISTMEDLMNIQLAGGLGDVRLEIAPDATPELLAQISAIRAKPTRPGDKLTKPQEDRLVRGLPATGPGSRGGRGSRGRRGTRGGRQNETLFAESDSDGGNATPAGWDGGQSEQPEAGPSGTRAETAAAEATAGAEVDKEGDVQMAAGAEVDREGDVQMAPAETPEAAREADSEDELREIDEEDLQALQK